MKRIIMFEIDCGDKTCASEPGRFCPFFCTQRLGTVFVCALFKTNGCPTKLKDSQGDGLGWALRCDQCLEQERITDEIENSDHHWTPTTVLPTLPTNMRETQ